MKFFFKVFFTTMFLVVACTAVAGYLLIRDNVSSLLESETMATVESGSVAAYALSAADPTDSLLLGQTAAAMEITYGGEALRFLLLDREGTVLYSSLPDSCTAPLSALRDPENRTWTIGNLSGVRYVLALRPILLADTLCYVGTIRNISQVAAVQLRQYQLLLKILLATVVLGGGVTLLVTRLLTGQLRAISVTSRRIASGTLDCRAPVCSNDEFGQLAAQFNRMADTLEEKIDALQEENERRVLFTGAFAHELKTPLTSIIGYADLLRSKATDERTDLCANYIFSEGQRLERLSMRLLDLIVMRQHQLQLETVETGEFFSRVTMAAGGAVTLDVEPAQVRMESALLHTVFLNLLDNGRKAMAGAEGTLSLTGRVQGTDYLVIVRDQGCGMSPEQLEKIRRPFYRVDPSRSRAQGGFGLGLAICDEILTLHGFTLTYESAPGQGTAAAVTMKGAVIP